MTEEVRTLYDRFMLDKNNLFPSACKPQSTACGWQIITCEPLFDYIQVNNIVWLSWVSSLLAGGSIFCFQKKSFYLTLRGGRLFRVLQYSLSVLIVVFSLFLCIQTLAFVDLWLCRISNPLSQFYINNSTSRFTTYLEIIDFCSTRFQLQFYW